MQPTRRSFMRAGFAIGAGAAVMRFTAARASSESPYSDAAFAAAQAAGKPIVIHVAASWCPTCAAQKPILDSIAGQPDYVGLVRFRVDFDSQKAACRRFGATMQSTIVVFHGATEEGRAVGVTDPDALRALIAKTKA